MPGAWNRGGSISALDCRTVRQRRITSSFRLDSPARNLPTLSRTAGPLPRHTLPVASSLAQPQMALSALKSGVYPAEPALVKTGVYQPKPQTRSPQGLPHGLSAVGRCIVPDDPQRPRVLFPKLLQEGNRAPSVAVPVPSIPPRPSPSTPPNNSWPSRRAAGRSSPPSPALPLAPTCPAVPYPPGSGPHRQRISWPGSGGPPPTG